MPIFSVYIAANFFKSDRVEVGERELLELLLDALHTEAMSERRENVHRFERGDPALLLRFRVERPHIVQSVTKLYEDDANVLRHREEHFPEILDLRFLFVLYVKMHKFCQPVDEHCDIIAKFLTNCH